ncbi:MAG: NDP-hexose 2,3-dehydratase family protein [Pseudomonadota bacterium]
MKASYKVAKSSDELLNFLDMTARESQYSLERIPIAEQAEWTFSDSGITHKSGGFFSVCGVSDRDKVSDSRLMLYQPQSALTGLILYRSEHGTLVLLQARVEPGNTNVIQYGPTIQSTPANYLRLHGGKATSYVENFTEYLSGTNLLTHSMQLDLACRYFQKSKTHHYLEVDTPISTLENMVWASLPAISGLLKSDNVLNADLRSLLSVFDWTAFENSLESEDTAVQSDHFRAAPQLQLGRFRLNSLEELEDWQKDEYGISSEKYGTGVSMYRFGCTNREVKTWSQPLFTVKDEGAAQLLMRHENSTTEFLVTIDTEPGLSTSNAFYPSYLSSPAAKSIIGKKCERISNSPRLLQCDEGGRFHQNNTSYELIEGCGDFEYEDNQLWISSAALRGVLRDSNRASFPLRCAASMVLDSLHQTWKC